MTGLIWTALGVAAWVGVIALAAARVHARTIQGRETERASRPEALRDAKLVYVEKLFRIRSPINLVAKLDRGYRNPDGQIVLVELKTRWSHKAYLTDVIQLSAQRGWRSSCTRVTLLRLMATYWSGHRASVSSRPFTGSNYCRWTY